ARARSSRSSVATARARVATRGLDLASIDLGYGLMRRRRSVRSRPDASPMGEPMRVALTIDTEHPDQGNCPHESCDLILDYLHASGVRATFFVQGRWALANP